MRGNLWHMALKNYNMLTHNISYAHIHTYIYMYVHIRYDLQISTRFQQGA